MTCSASIRGSPVIGTSCDVLYFVGILVAAESPNVRGVLVDPGADVALVTARVAGEKRAAVVQIRYAVLSQRAAWLASSLRVYLAGMAGDFQRPWRCTAGRGAPARTMRCAMPTRPEWPL